MFFADSMAWKFGALLAFVHGDYHPADSQESGPAALRKAMTIVCGKGRERDFTGLDRFDSKKYGTTKYAPMYNLFAILINFLLL